MIEVAGAARGDHRDVDGRGNSFQKRQIVAIARAVPVHAGEQDFAGAAASHFSGPGDDVEPGGAPPAVGVDTPTVPVSIAASVDSDNDALATEYLRPGVNKIWIANGRGVDRHLVGAGRKQFAHVDHGPHAAPDRQWDKHLRSEEHTSE